MRVRVLRTHLDGDQKTRKRGDEFELEDRAAIPKIKGGLLEPADGGARKLVEKAARSEAPENKVKGSGGGRPEAGKGKKPQSSSSESSDTPDKPKGS